MAGKAEVDLFIRSFQTLLRSTGEVRVAGLLEPYLAMDPTLHSRARNPQPDAAALTYVGLRLPPSMPDVRLVLLSTSIEAIESRGYDLTSWRPQSSPARRRRQFFDGGERVAVLVLSDVEHICPPRAALPHVPSHSAIPPRGFTRSSCVVRPRVALDQEPLINFGAGDAGNFRQDCAPVTLVWR